MGGTRLGNFIIKSIVSIYVAQGQETESTQTIENRMPSLQTFRHQAEYIEYVAVQSIITKFFNLLNSVMN